MDRIDKALLSYGTNPNLSVSIKAAVAIGVKTLNRYYSKTDLSEVNRTAMSK
jgi:hypothetical protein